ncbi:AMP-binding protein [Pectobacterium sp. CFBP8739]|uniref:AMP-binding protein n=1 Tax=Pectobacterium sp. CFBP8739 TaxID=2748908 RepID=UPI0015DDFBEC|nr:AMP-binding protein [Pectobacterium sp. CFBP8739]MBA0167944.1 AMP-binding protein [Pectobacterium sp. CFBP8739]
MFLNLSQHDTLAIAAVNEDGRELRYGELLDLAQQLANCLPARSLVFSFCENTMGSLIGYVSFLTHDIVPLMLDKDLDPALCDQLITTYRPGYLWRPFGVHGPCHDALFTVGNYELVPTGLEHYPLHPDLALLVSTSGSTGSPRLVRQSYRNILSNACSIAEYLGISSQERPVLNLPMNYVYGMSIINSHLLKGATLLLTTRSIMQREFWSFIKEYEASSLAGVPYTYEMLKKLRFMTMKLPALKTLTQAGGKLLPELHGEFARYAQDTGRDFIVMYGAAEATSRMGYLPPDKALEKCGSMGIPIPGGRFDIIDENGDSVERDNYVGELVYYGDNVALGYAECGADLQQGDEHGGRLNTGDMVKRDKDGYYYVVGRKKRFLKIFGNRVGLDEVELMIRGAFPTLDCACGGTDDRLYIFITDDAFSEQIKQFIALKTQLNHTAFRVKVLPLLPQNNVGKILYAKLEAYYDPL